MSLFDQAKDREGEGSNGDEGDEAPPAPPVSSPPPPPPSSPRVPCKKPDCGEDFENSLQLANHTRIAHREPKPPKPRKSKRKAAADGGSSAAEDQPPVEPLDGGVIDASTTAPVTVDERARLVGKVRSMMARAGKLERDLREDFAPDLERLRVHSTQLSAATKLTRPIFTEIENAVEGDIRPVLEDLEDLSRDVPSSRRRRLRGEGGEGGIEAMYLEQIKKLELKQKIKELKDFLGGRSGESDADKIEVVMNGIPVRVRPETAAYWAGEKERREKEEKIEREERAARLKYEQENSPMMVMQRERMQMEQENNRRREEENRRRDDETRRREDEFRRQMEQRDREHRELLERMRTESQASQQAVADARIEALKKEVDEWSAVAKQPASDRIKEVLDEVEAITGKKPRLGGSGADPDEVRAATEQKAVDTGMSAVADTLREGFKAADRRAAAHQRRADKLETMLLEERRRADLEDAPRPPPMSAQEQQRRMRETMERQRQREEPDEEPEKEPPSEEEAPEVEASQGGQPEESTDGGWGRLGELADKRKKKKAEEEEKE